MQSGNPVFHRICRAVYHAPGRPLRHPDYTTPFLVDTMTTRASSVLINIITPDEKTVVRGNAIIGGATVEIMRGCEGIEGMLLLIAAVLAFPARGL
jgi:exosortase/archaeosortase